jgi:hypothetical protein
MNFKLTVNSERVKSYSKFVEYNLEIDSKEYILVVYQSSKDGEEFYFEGEQVSRGDEVIRGIKLQQIVEQL